MTPMLSRLGLGDFSCEVYGPGLWSVEDWILDIGYMEIELLRWELEIQCNCTGISSGLYVVP